MWKVVETKCGEPSREDTESSPMAERGKHGRQEETEQRTQSRNPRGHRAAERRGDWLEVGRLEVKERRWEGVSASSQVISLPSHQFPTTPPLRPKKHQGKPPPLSSFTWFLVPWQSEQSAMMSCEAWLRVEVGRAGLGLVQLHICMYVYVSMYVF